MCHRQRDWSRASSGTAESGRATEFTDERDEERAPWTARARDRLVALVSTGEEGVESVPEEPTVNPATARSEVAEDAEESTTEDEREEELIPADD